MTRIQYQEMCKTTEGLQKLVDMQREYAESKGLATSRVGWRFYKTGKVVLYVLPENHRRYNMNVK